MTGKCLPYQKFGFNSLIEFIQNLGTFKIVDTGCEIIIYALSNEKTKHMDSFINKYEKPTVCIKNHLNHSLKKLMYSFYF